MPWKNIGKMVLSGIIGALVILLFAPFALAIIKHPTTLSQSWTTIGVLATLTGLLAALFGIAFAVVLAYQWLSFDQRVETKLQGELNRFHSEIDRELRERLQAISELALAFSGIKELTDRESIIERLLLRVPDTPNAASLTSQMFINAGNYTTESTKERALYWANKALDNAEFQDPGLPDWVKSQALALYREPQGCLQHLSKAIDSKIITPNEFTENDWLWQIFSSITHDESELQQLDMFLYLIGLKRPTTEEFEKHCEHPDNLEHATFWVVEKTTGQSKMVTASRKRDPNNNNIWLWGVLDNRGQIVEPIPFADFITYCQRIWILTRLVGAKS